MPFNRPTPSQILERIQAEIDIALPGADARLRHSVEGVIARVLSMASHEMFGFLIWNSKQILPDSAEAEYLERHAALWGIARTAATAAQGSITFTGTNGAVIPAGAIVKRTDGAEYTLDADITIASGSGTGAVTASLAGSNGNAAAATRLTLASPVAGIVSEAVAAAGGLSEGTDIESDAGLRSRIIERIQRPPHGGAAYDYIAWGKEVAGVTRVWVYPEQLGLGTVVVIFVMDNKAGTIIPDSGEVAAVQEHIDAVRPVTADVSIAAPTAVSVNLNIAINPNSIAVKTAIEAEIRDFFRRESEPGGTLYLSRLNEAISAAPGEFDHVLVSPTVNIVRSFGEISILGTITWSAL